MRNAECGIAHSVNSVRGAGAPSPPSEEGGGTAYKGLKRRDGRRDTPSICESSQHKRTLNNNDTCITLCTPTPLCKQQPRVISPSVVLPKSLMQSASSLLRGSQGRSRAVPQIRNTGGAEIRAPSPSVRKGEARRLRRTPQIRLRRPAPLRGAIAEKLFEHIHVHIAQAVEHTFVIGVVVEVDEVFAGEHCAAGIRR